MASESTHWVFAEPPVGVKFSGRLPPVTSTTPVSRNDVGHTLGVFTLGVLIGLLLPFDWRVRCTIGFALGLTAAIPFWMVRRKLHQERLGRWDEGSLHFESDSLGPQTIGELYAYIAIAVSLMFPAILLLAVMFGKIEWDGEAVSTVLPFVAVATLFCTVGGRYLRTVAREARNRRVEVIDVEGLTLGNGDRYLWSDLITVQINDDTFFLAFSGGPVVVNPKPMRFDEVVPDVSGWPARRDTSNVLSMLLLPLAPPESRPATLCSACGEVLQDASLASVATAKVAIPVDRVEEFATALEGLQVPCSNCERISCTTCSALAGKRRGLRNFVCPHCDRVHAEIPVQSSD